MESLSWRIVSGAHFDVILKIASGELDMVKRAVMSHPGRYIDQLILVSLSGFNLTKIVVAIRFRRR